MSNRPIKWHNKPLKYLLANNPEKVISEKGVKFRKKTRPIVKLFLPLFNPYKLFVLKRTPLPKNRSIVYAPSHGFKDDVINSVMTIDNHFFILFGSLDQLFNHPEGYLPWVNGIAVVDRTNAESRQAGLPKMERIMSYGTNGLIFPEATWNQNESLLISKLFHGVYDLAKSTNSLVVPVVTLPIEKKCYSIRGKAFDITKRNKSKSEKIITDIQKRITKINDLLLDEYDIGIDIKELVHLLSFYDVNDFEKNYKIIDEIVIKALDIKKSIQELEDDDSIKNSIIKRTTILLSAIINAEKRVSIDILRDRMATYKFHLISKYANYSNIPREELEEESSLKEQWDKFWQDEKKKVKYYNLQEELDSVYIDKTEISEYDVFKQFENVKTLELTRSKR